MANLDTVEPLINEKIESLGLELYEIKFIRAGSHSILRIFIEKDGGIGVDDCESASRAVSEILDEIDFHSGKYTLEVSSPGIDRPLTTEKDFSRMVGKSLKLRVEGEKGRAKTVNGTLTSFDNGILVIKEKKGTIEIPFESVLSGKMNLTF